MDLDLIVNVKVYIF